MPLDENLEEIIKKINDLNMELDHIKEIYSLLAIKISDGARLIFNLSLIIGGIIWDAPDGWKKLCACLSGIFLAFLDWIDYADRESMLRKIDTRADLILQEIKELEMIMFREQGEKR